MTKVDDAMNDAQRRMKGALDALHRELDTVRTGRASTALIDSLPIDYYGSSMPLNQLASITAPEARLLVIQPWDKGAFGPIEKSILKSDLGISPTSDGNVIRLAIPSLTEERRKEMAKLVHKKVEDEKVAIRNVRRDVLDHVRKLEKDKEVSQDEEHRGQDQLQKLTDRMISEVEKIGKAKEEEVLEV